MTVQFATFIALALAFLLYAGLLLSLGARRRRVRIAAVRQALIRRKRGHAGNPGRDSAAGAVG